jgi:hypothetical protein
MTLIHFPSTPAGFSPKLADGEYNVLFSTNPFYRKHRQAKIVYANPKQTPEGLWTMEETMLYKSLSAKEDAGYSKAIGWDQQLAKDDSRFSWRMTGPFPLGLLFMRNTTAIIGHAEDYSWLAVHVGSTMLNSECVQIFCRKDRMDPELFKRLRAELEDLELVKSKRAAGSWGDWVAIYHDGKEGERYADLVKEKLLDVVTR